MLAAQTPPSAHRKVSPAQHKVSAQHRRAVPRRHSASTRKKAAPAAAVQPPAPPPAPPPPDWPVKQEPKPAKVTWDSRGLEIQASNSSLDQILHEVATDIGAKVQGLSQDQRIFGTYGPGPARDVLSDLLDGSGYNVLMVGDQGGGAPREIVLSTSGPAGAHPAGNPRPPMQAEEPRPYPVYQQPHPMPIRNPFGNAEPRTPQQVIQEMQQRREEIEQEREEQQNNQQR